jgi:hypothetical protein
MIVLSMGLPGQSMRALLLGCAQVRCGLSDEAQDGLSIFSEVFAP